MELMKAIAMRRSTRAYKTEQIDPKDLETIIYAASAAPVGNGEYNNMRLTVVQNPEMLARIDLAHETANSLPGFAPLYGAPTFIIVSAKRFDGKPKLISYCDVGCVIDHMLLAATDLDLVSVFQWTPIAAMVDDEELMKDLKIPPGFEPISGVGIGYAVEPLVGEKPMDFAIRTNLV